MKGWLTELARKLLKHVSRHALVGPRCRDSFTSFQGSPVKPFHPTCIDNFRNKRLYSSTELQV